MSAEKDLRRQVFDWLETEGAVAVGVSTRETLAGGPRMVKKRNPEKLQ